tara:strand:- start:1088 stop:1657 length:570 start_codon:yes stop_codon:yes gene_type:complete
MSGTKINDLVANSGKSNEDSMVDSIINELNNDGNEKGSQQQQMPQLTEQEREMLMKQQMMEQQMLEQQKMQQMAQMQQQQMQQQQMQQQMAQQQIEEKELEKELEEELLQEDKNVNMLDYVKNVNNLKDTFIVIILTILINLDPIDGLLKFKEIPAFYDIEADKSTFLFFLVKAIIVGVVFYLLQYFTK